MLEEQSKKVQFVTANFEAGWLDFIFPYHVLFGSKTKYRISDTEEVELSKTLKYYRTQRMLVLTLFDKNVQTMLTNK